MFPLKIKLFCATGIYGMKFWSFANDMTRFPFCMKLSFNKNQVYYFLIENKIE